MHNAIALNWDFYKTL